MSSNDQGTDTHGLRCLGRQETVSSCETRSSLEERRRRTRHVQKRMWNPSEASQRTRPIRFLAEWFTHACSIRVAFACSTIDGSSRHGHITCDVTLATIGQQWKCLSNTMHCLWNQSTSIIADESKETSDDDSRNRCMSSRTSRRTKHNWKRSKKNEIDSDENWIDTNDQQETK